MSETYDSHADYMSWVSTDADARKAIIEDNLRKAFASHIETQSTDVILFSDIEAMKLGKILARLPLILKPLASICNVAARSIERDLNIKNIDTYNPRLSERQAIAIAGYLKPFLPPVVSVPTLVSLDRTDFIDKEIRKAKGRWEKGVIESLNDFGALEFKKRMFTAAGESFELGAATPIEGDVKIGIDVKRIEARRDIHKRCDEIVNKAAKLKSSFPKSKFGAVIYPFFAEHVNIQNRLLSENIDAVVFASQSRESVEDAVKMLLARFEVRK